MTQAIQNLRLRATSGELAGKWLWTIGLAAKSGAQFRGALPFEDADRHPENYVIHPQFIDEEKSAWKSSRLKLPNDSNAS
jgi:hypothetical protein